MASGDKRAARVEMANAMRDIFKKYTRGARSAAWNSMCSKDGQDEMDKLLNNPGRPTTRFRTISFREFVEFRSKITESSEWTHKNWRSEDGTVGGDLDIDDHFKYIGIWNWHSIKEGKGNTVKALQELKQKYPDYKIEVLAAMDDAIPYWLKMGQRGLVDTIQSAETNKQIFP